MSKTFPEGDDAHTLPDPVTFTVDALVARGALVERVAPHHLAVLPPPLAQSLRTAEEIMLAGADEAAEGVASIALGSGLLEDLLTFVKQGTARSCVRLPLEASRATQARALGDRFTVRNGVVEVVSTTAATTTYLHAWTAFSVEADDRREGLLHLCCHTSGDTPDQAFRNLALEDACVDVTDHGMAFDDRAVALMVARTKSALSATVAPFLQQVERRSHRDKARIRAYFKELCDETRASRRIKDEGARARKLEAFGADERQKLADIDARFTLRTSAKPVALLAVSASVQQVVVRVRRRKGERLLTLRLPPAARALDTLHCAACDGATDRPAVCDDQLHLLCSACVPRVEGRVSCPACSAARPGKSPVR